jgi:hypothetical protein
MEAEKGVKTQFTKSSNFIEKQNYFNLQVIIFNLE